MRKSGPQYIEFGETRWINDGSITSMQWSQDKKAHFLSCGLLLVCGHTTFFKIAETPSIENRRTGVGLHTNSSFVTVNLKSGCLLIEKEKNISSPEVSLDNPGM